MLVGICLAAALAHSYAQTPGRDDPFPDTLAHHWAFKAAEDLWPNWLDGLKYQHPVPTRRDFANRIATADGPWSYPGPTPIVRVRWLNDRIRDLGSAESRDLDNLFFGLADLLNKVVDDPDSEGEAGEMADLAQEFRGALVAGGYDPAKLDKEIAAWRSVRDVSPETRQALSEGQRPFPDTKRNHWAYQALTHLKAEGLIRGYPIGNFVGGRLSTCYEMALETHMGYSALLNLRPTFARAIEKDRAELKTASGKHDRRLIRSIEQDIAGAQDALNDLSPYIADLNNLRRLGQTFSHELGLLGVDLKEFDTNLARLRIDFSDKRWRAAAE